MVSASALPALNIILEELRPAASAAASIRRISLLVTNCIT